MPVSRLLVRADTPADRPSEAVASGAATQRPSALGSPTYVRSCAASAAGGATAIAPGSVGRPLDPGAATVRGVRETVLGPLGPIRASRRSAQTTDR